MGRRRASRATTRGGDGIPAPRRTRPALAAGAASVAVAGWLAIWPALLSHGDRAKMLLAIGVAGLGVLAAGVLLGWVTTVAAGVFLLGGAYATYLVLDDPPLDGRAALVGGGLLLAAELGSWSVELRRERTDEPGRRLRRLVAELGLCVGGLAVSALVLAAADIGRVGGVAIEVVGAIAATILFWFALQTLRRPHT